MKQFITRFAPSPTGFLHIGGVRTALFNYLYTQNIKKQNQESKFLLRIEDTDKLRSTKEFESSIINGLKWLGINWDDKIYRQSEHSQTHIKIANDLLKNGGAFKCTCSREKIEAKRSSYIKQNLNIKRLCTTCEDNEKIQSLKDGYCIRIKIPDKDVTSIRDEIQGKLEIKNNQIDNYILLRTDGTPTYMLSVVVDDHLMGVTHIIRGDDHLNNAFRQTHLYKNLNWDLPTYGHIPLIHGEDGSKLSKRHGAVDINQFKNEGYLPAAILNYLMKIGIFLTDEEFFDIQLAISKFNINSILKSPSRFDYKKINYINSYYLSQKKESYLINEMITSFNLSISKQNKEIIDRAVSIYKKRSCTFLELKENITPYLNNNSQYKEKIDLSIKSRKIIVDFYKEIISDKNISDNDIENRITKYINSKKIKFVDLGKPLRLILTGVTNGPTINEIFYILGRSNIIKRIDNFLF